VTTNVDVPPGVVLLVFTVSVEEPEVVTDVGLKVAVAPVGNPPTLSPTVPPNPFSAPTVTVYVAAIPALTDCDDGVAVMVKSGGGGTAFTTSVTVAA
jgi:hypothetical protein